MKELIESSPRAIEEFMKTTVYKDFLHEIFLRAEKLTELLLDEGVQYSQRDYDRFRGGITNLTQMGDIFMNLLDNKTTDLENEGENDG